MAIRLGIIGAGQVALRHVARLGAFENVKIKAVADVDEERGRTLAKDHSAIFFDDYHRMLESDLDLDAAINCLPHNLHYESSKLMADRDLHVLLEKPMCLSLKETDELVTIFKARGLKLAIGYVHRFRGEVLAAKRLIDEGRLGELAMITETLYSKGGARVPAWVWNKCLSGGGVLMYTGIHVLDRFRWFAGSEAIEVSARMLSYSHDTKTEDGLVATISFKNGVVASLFETQTAYEPLSKWDGEVFGSKGMLRIKIGDKVEFSDNQEQFSQSFDRYDHFERQLQDFFGAIEDNREPWITGYDGRQSLAIALAIYESAASGVPVKVG